MEISVMGTWIFQGDPDTFDIDGYLQTARRIRWTVRQAHLADKMRPGDRVFLWRAKGSAKESVAGVVASGWLESAPTTEADDPVAHSFWLDNEHRGGDHLRVRIEVDRVVRGSKEIVQSDWLRRDPVLHDLRILRLRSETNYLLSDEHAARLEDLWRNTNRPWNHAESIAGLWAYHETYDQAVSLSPGSPVAIVAERIGRAVTGVYNKVMNFRALDPRDSREGLAAGGQVDRAVWAEFFDDAKQELRGAALNLEFERLWPPGSADQPEVTTDEELASVTSGRGGQGFIKDPALRKAIEDRAMEVALEHYRARFSSVENTSKSKPYDLRAADDGLELRVEVKGSTGTGADIRLTMGEVANARGDGWRTDLFVVTNIRVTPSPDGPQAHGGDVRVFEDWTPLDEHLKATVFRYRVPE
jgi:hypothetical protein